MKLPVDLLGAPADVAVTALPTVVKTLRLVGSPGAVKMLPRDEVETLDAIEDEVLDAPSSVELEILLDAVRSAPLEDVSSASFEEVLVRPMPTGTDEIDDVLTSGVTEERYDELDDAVVTSN